MVLPFILIAVAIIATTTTVYNWDEIKIAWKGKKLAILGARAIGKTSLVQFLTTGTIPFQYNQSVKNTKTESRRFRLADLEILVKRSFDVPGTESVYNPNSGNVYNSWRDVVSDADIVLYLWLL